jgi:hypothetical protein
MTPFNVEIPLCEYRLYARNMTDMVYRCVQNSWWVKEGVYGVTLRRRLSSPCVHATVFLAQIFAILSCAEDSMEME